MEVISTWNLTFRKRPRQPLYSVPLLSLLRRIVVTLVPDLGRWHLQTILFLTFLNRTSMAMIFICTNSRMFSCWRKSDWSCTSSISSYPTKISITAKPMHLIHWTPSQTVERRIDGGGESDETARCSCAVRRSSDQYRLQPIDYFTS